MDPIRWGVLGAAAIAIDRFMPAMAGARAATLAGIASRSADKAKAVAQTFAIPRHFDSYEALIDDPGIDALYVPVPNHLHVEWSVRALEAGKHVLCEKPLCLSAKDVLALIAARDRSGRHIEEAFSYRNHPQWAKIGELLAGGAIGAPRAVHGTLARQFLDPNDIRNNPDQGGGALYDLGSYTISACSAALGRAPKRVIAAIDRDPAWKIDRLSTALLDYGDAHATFTVGIAKRAVGGDAPPILDPRQQRLAALRSALCARTPHGMPPVRRRSHEHGLVRDREIRLRAGQPVHAAGRAILPLSARRSRAAAGRSRIR